MKKIFIFAIAVSVLLSVSFLEAQTKAQQTYTIQDYPILTPLKIVSPSNVSYNYNSIMLNISTNFGESPNTVSITYSLDSSSNVTLPIQTKTFPIIVMVPNPGAPPDYMSPSGTPMYGFALSSNISLPELSEGQHQVTLYEEVNFPKLPTFYDSKTVYFLIDYGISPRISNLSIENKTYQKTILPMNFFLDEQTSWVGYFLDDNANITIYGNTTLNNLAYGSHSLAIYANDTAGNMGVQKTIYFNVEKPTISSTELILAAIIVFLILMVVALIIYMKKYSKRKQLLTTSKV